MKGQAAIMDALFFMTICAGAATMMFFTSGLYGSSTNQQIITIYNYEYGGTALVAMHYAKDLSGNWFWTELKNKLNDPNEVKVYLEDEAATVWANVTYSSPSKYVYLCFYGTQQYCYPGTPDPKKRAYTSSVTIVDSSGKSWDVILEMLY